MKFPQLRRFVASHLPLLAWYGGLSLFGGLLLFWKLGTLPGGYSAAELSSYAAAQDVGNLLTAPFFAPFLLAVKGLSFILTDTLLVSRLVATIGGLAVLAAFALVLRQWQDRTTTVVGTALLASSAWFLHLTRSGTPDVMLLGVFVLMATSYWLAKTNHWLPLLCCFALAIGLLYIPGAIWFIAIGVLWQWKTIDASLKRYPFIIMLGGLLLLAGLAPLGWALYKHTDLIMPWLALPSSIPAPLDMVRNILAVPYHLFVHGSANPAMWLGAAAIFDFFSLAMFALGGYLYMRQLRRKRTLSFLAIFAITTALIAIGAPLSILAILLPFMYLIIAVGAGHLLQQWLTVFPRNPIARNVGRVLLAAVVVIACSYQLTHYFIGWPHATATHEVFTVQKP